MRLIASCKNCKSQYDVSSQRSHDHFHCRCGGVVEVPEPRAAEARLVRCASCGAVRGAGGSNCEFCGARYSSVDKGWGSMCPECYCRLPNDAQFCVECGVKISPQKLDAIRSDLLCPRCQCTMQDRAIEKISMTECGGCGGLWLGVDTFRILCEDKQTLEIATVGLARKKRRVHFELTEAEEVKYVPCPVCKHLMNRRNFGRVSGVIIDTCRECGVWLDNQELNRIIQFIQAGGLEKGREAERRDREHAERMRKISVPSMKRGSPVAFSFGSTSSEITENGTVVPVLAKVAVEIAKAFLKM